MLYLYGVALLQESAAMVAVADGRTGKDPSASAHVASSASNCSRKPQDEHLLSGPLYCGVQEDTCAPGQHLAACLPSPP